MSDTKTLKADVETIRMLTVKFEAAIESSEPTPTGTEVILACAFIVSAVGGVKQ